MNTDLIAHIEKAIATDVGRSIDELAAMTSGGLLAAAKSITDTPAPKIGIITGFFIPHATPPAAENDGLVGTAHMVAGFVNAGFDVRLATDGLCESALRATVAVSGANVPIDVVQHKPGGNGTSMEGVIAAWQNAGITHAISIERCGLSHDGKPRNARGDDISAHTAPLDELFLGGPWDTIAIGDGGNEIGMGALDREIISKNIKNGSAIACRTPAKHLIVAGVSNWGAWGLLAAMATLLPQKRVELTATLTPEKELEMLRYINQHGPSVDGMAGKPKDTVDGIEFEFHEKILEQVIDIIS